MREVVITSPEPEVAPWVSATNSGVASRLGSKLFAPIDIAPLVFFRITFGVLMILEVCGYVVSGLVAQNWIQPEMHFTYFGFGWVHPPPGNSIYVLLGILTVAALGITVGLFYRTCATVFAVGFTWFYLIEQSNYMNHFYLICLLAFVALVIPANRACSLDARRDPALRASTAPAWTLWLLQAHMAIAYFFGGVAKLNHDWLRGEPLRTWLFTGNLGEKLGPFFQNEFFVYLISYSGLALDLFIVPFLLWKRTRLLALLAAIAFHLSNAYLFKIGVFPFLSIAMTLLFLSPAWHRRILRLRPPVDETTPYWRRSRTVLLLLSVYLFYHLFMPMRHWLYPGSVHWTEEGHRYAWHMMLRTKSGTAYFIVEDRGTGELWRVRPREHLGRRQYSKMAVHPQMLLQFAHHLRERWSPRDVAVYAVSHVRLNGRMPALLVDPEVDLSRVQPSLLPARWILPLENDRAVPRRFRSAKDSPKS